MRAGPMRAGNPISSHATGLGPPPYTAAPLDGQAVPAGSFTDFYRENFPVIVTIIMQESFTGYVGAQDIAQDAFIIALRDWDRISRMDYPLAYIAKTAVRLARRRSIKAAREIPTNSAAGLLTTIPAAEPAGIASVEDLTAQIVASLPERQAATVRLLMNGATPEEIGKILGVQASTVRSNLRFARASLKTLMREQMDDKPAPGVPAAAG
jgi:RNA polymerase sigma factor (sigma-70 family)